MKVSEFMDWLEQLPTNTDIEIIGREKSLQGDILIVQYASGALAPRERSKLCDELAAHGLKFALIEYMPGRGPVEFLSIRKPA